MTLLAVALLVGSVAAFAHTEQLKLERSPVGQTRFDRWLSPGCSCPGETAELSFVLREPERIDVTVVDGGEVVRSLATELRRPGGRVSFTWDGRDSAGRVAPDGDYSIRVRLRDERRTIVIPKEVHVDTRPPRARVTSVSPALLAAGQRLRVRYMANEYVRPVLLVDGQVAARGRLRPPGARQLTWTALLDGASPAPGPHELVLVVEDRAENRSDPTEAFTIVVTGA